MVLFLWGTAIELPQKAPDGAGEPMPLHDLWHRMMEVYIHAYWSESFFFLH